MGVIKTRSDYFTPVRKRTSIGNSTRSKPKNKHKRKSWKNIIDKANHEYSFFIINVIIYA